MVAIRRRSGIYKIIVGDWRKNATNDPMQFVFANEKLNSRQTLMLNKLLDGFNGKLSSSKWAKITKCSQDTAGRDISDLIDRGILTKGVSGRRSTTYELVAKKYDLT